MSAVEKLINIQEKNNSYICLGLDLDPKKMPSDNTLSIKGMYEFAMNIVEATKDHVCAYKPNIAFYENLGHDGLSLLESIVNRMPDNIPIILDCKRGDIGNTASFYAEAMFEKLNADWVTLSPYMGYDSMRPFLEYKDKGIFVLCLTSNSGSKDFQLLDVGGKPLYEVVAEKVDYWNKEDNCGLVVGATNPEQLKDLRTIAKNMPLLIPGVGAQGGSLEKSLIYGTDNFTKPAVINVSRSVLYASNGSNYAEKARDELIKLNKEAQQIKLGEKTESTEQKTETVEQESPTKTQVQGFTPPVEKTQQPVKTDEQQSTSEPVKPTEQTHSQSQPVTPPQAPQPNREQQTEPSQPVQSYNSEKNKTVESSEPVKSPPPLPTPPPIPQEQKEQQPQTSDVEHKNNEPEKTVEQSEPKRTPPPLPTPPPIPQEQKEQQPQTSDVEHKNNEPEKTVEQAEPKRTPPPLPTPPPILQPNPEVMRRNREEQERRLKALQEQKQNRENGDSNQNEKSQNESENQQNHNNFQPRKHNRNNR